MCLWNRCSEGFRDAQRFVIVFLVAGSRLVRLDRSGYTRGEMTLWFGTRVYRRVSAVRGKDPGRRLRSTVALTFKDKKNYEGPFDMCA